MNQLHKNLLEQCYNLSQKILANDGYITPVYILIKDDAGFPIVHDIDISISQYANIVIEYASDHNMDAAILICEQNILTGNKTDPEMQPYINGEKPIMEHPDYKRHLTGCYMTAEGHHETMVAEIHTEPSKGTKYVMEPVWLDDIETTFLTPWR
jgi:hypothetical protein